MIAIRPIFDALLADCALVHVNFNPQFAGAVVPSPHNQSQTVILSFGLNLPNPIKDLVTDDAGIRGTLSFGGVPFHCTVPWDSIYAMEGEGSVMVLFSRPNKITEVAVQPERPKLRLV